MPPRRRWTAPPTRREITILLFCITVFVLSYNIETSLRLVGVHPSKLSTSYLSTIGLGAQDPGFEPDGRRPLAWRDELEDLIVGDWEWPDGKVSSIVRGQTDLRVDSDTLITPTYSKGNGKEDMGIGTRSGVKPKEQFVVWGSAVPQTRALVHVPGYTVLDRLILVNGTVYIVTDNPASIPPLGAIASSAADRTQPPRPRDWQIISRQEAAERLGPTGGMIRGTTWIATDPSAFQDPYTILSLFRVHSAFASSHSAAVSSSISSSDLHTTGLESGLGNVSVAAPMRLIFSHVPTFSSPQLGPPNGDLKEHPPPRVRSYDGLHPLLPKAALPPLGMWYSEDWDDLVEMSVPWVFERVIVADRGAAERGRARWAVGWTPDETDTSEVPGKELRKRDDDEPSPAELAQRAEGAPAWAAPFIGLHVPEGWWTPVRATLMQYLRVPDMKVPESKWGRKTAVPKPVITYVSMQAERAGAGPQLVDEHHQALVAGLRALEREGVVGEVHIVKGNGSVPGWEWNERMSAIVRSSMVIGPYGHHLADSVFMSPSLTHSTQQQKTPPVLMELFPSNTFVRDQEYAVRALGMRYIAWLHERKYMGNSLPPVMLPNARAERVRIPIDVQAVLGCIRDELLRRPDS